MKKLTFEEEIDAISKAFKISPQKIKEIINPKKIKKRKDSTSSSKVKPEEPKNLSRSTPKSFSFDSFEDEYILSNNEEEEIKVLKKYVSVCNNILDIKTLYNLCPQKEKELKGELILLWVNLASNLEEIREVRALTTRGTIAGDIAYAKFIKFFK